LNNQVGCDLGLSALVPGLHGELSGIFVEHFGDVQGMGVSILQLKPASLEKI